MTTSNKCNHALEIAEDMYNAYADGKDSTEVPQSPTYFGTGIVLSAVG